LVGFGADRLHQCAVGLVDNGLVRVADLNVGRTATECLLPDRRIVVVTGLANRRRVAIHGRADCALDDGSAVRSACGCRGLIDIRSVVEATFWRGHHRGGRGAAASGCSTFNAVLGDTCRIARSAGFDAGLLYLREAAVAVLVD